MLRKLASQTFLYGSSIILARLINLAFTPIYTNLFPKEIYGIFTNLYAYVAVVNVLLSFGMETTFFRFVQDESDPKKIYGQAFAWVGLLVLLFAAVVGSLHAPIAALMGYPGRGELILLLLGIVVLDALAALPKARLRQEERVRWFAVIILTNVLVTLVANVVFVLWLRLGIEYVFVANLIASAIQFLMTLWRNVPTQLRPDPRLLRAMLPYAFFIMLAGLAGIMNETLDRIMLPLRWTDGTWFAGAARSPQEMNGIYGAIYKIAILIQLAIMAFRYAAEPFFFREASQKDSPRTFARVFHYFTLATLAGFLLIGSFDQEIVSFDFFGVFGPEWTFVDEDYWVGLDVVPILLLAYVFSGAYTNLSIWYKLTKQTRFALLFTSTGALITILVNYFGIPTYGYLASAWATLLCYATMAVMVYVAGQVYYPIPYRIGRVSLYGALFVGAFFLNQHIGPTNGYWLAGLAKVLICAATLGLVAVAERMWPVFSQARE
jgi:O-antigen/teichoic acid export membrane protein